MMIEGLGQIIAFYLLAGCTLASAAGVVFGRNLVQSAFLLALTFLSVAGLYLMLDAEFLAAVQAIVYSGAIAILIVIGVMLTQQEDMRSSNPSNRLFWVGGLTALSVTGLIVWAVLSTVWKTANHPPVLAGDLGRRFLTDFTVPFEAVALLLLAAMIGVVVLVKGGKETR
jgi:NADH:ubiquinone oxidoreductase subunit 6 (subunit J)